MLAPQQKCLDFLVIHMLSMVHVVQEAWVTLSHSQTRSYVFAAAAVFFLASLVMPCA